ncbi:MAG: class I SAM-dependent methyltransferase [Candidatus Omnitrophica bacterium]|nr:class I SAM-dependent methyltransferase [Candidatus Omnitrophota bacterium]
MNVSRVINNIYWRLQKIIVPTLRNSYFLYEDVLKSCVNPEMRWLDLGCGHQILPAWFPNSEERQLSLIRNCKTIVGIDYDLNSLRNHNCLSLKTRGCIDRLPFKDGSFDLVTANMVVEHLKNPEAVFKEVSRILSPEGIFIIHTTNTLSYLTAIGSLTPRKWKKKLISFVDGRDEEDVFGVYHRANTSRRIRSLAKMSGLNAAQIRMVVTSAQFRVLFPFVIFELLWIKILMTKLCKQMRTNIIAILKKQGSNLEDSISRDSAPCCGISV